ncbi:MAG TPA: cysteine--tRNA ligase [Oligoflexia bacterium]|nr:cysteine--tRNA ligase [Oligoflexia bacterium]HMP49573.1 cysteine--tRNA ligase [Oligoflexia bacterium]
MNNSVNESAPSTVSLFNTMERSIVPLSPLTDGVVKIYCCGPTVYNYQHIGNLRTYLFEDLLVRTLRYSSLNVKHVMNITDVGHLTSDADEGEDKMLLATKREGKRSFEIAEYYTNIFLSDCKDLNITRPDIICKASDHISQMIKLISQLMDKGYAYHNGGNVYFDVSRYEEYGKLTGRNLNELTQQLKAGARIEIDSLKRNPLDFALWFTNSKFENQELIWDSPWGKGYPGWHIECSAMAIEYLGESFDIHCGGIDHIPVHHTNEIAQSECATGKNFASIWMHGGFLVESGGKMSKSKGEFLTLSLLKEKGFDPLSYRYLCLGSHYRNELSWSWESIEGASQSLKKLKNRIDSLRSESKNKVKVDSNDNSLLFNHRERFEYSIRNDLNFPQALARTYELLGDNTISPMGKLNLIEEFDRVLGLNLLEVNAKDDIPEEIIKLASLRDQARKNKNFTESDSLRDKIESLGYTVKDSPSGYSISRK